MATEQTPPDVEAKTAEPAKSRNAVGMIGLGIIIIGVIFTIAGISTYALSATTLAAENITVAEDASRFAGQEVKGPFTAYAQADIIATHAEEIGGGKTYAELDQDDPVRETVMDASFLRASLFTSVVAFGVAAMAAVLGVVLIAVGWALRRISRSLPV